MTAFALLLLAVSAVPVLAEQPPPEDPPPASSPSEPSPVELPSPEDITAGLVEAEAEEEQRKLWLEGPQATQQRENSRLAYADLSPAESDALLREIFAELLAGLDDDPARFLSDAKLVRPLSATAATVKNEGNGQLMEGTMPVRTEDEDGELRKVDLSLKTTGSGFETANALVDLEIGASAADEVRIGEELSITQVGAASDSAAKRIDDESILFADVGTGEQLVDTDLLVAPIASGVELFSQLRSVRSPEELRFSIEMPEGAVLRLDGYGGAQILKGEKKIASIPAPYAIDAQGSEIPVEMEVEGETLLLHVPHREADLAYPLLVDPAIYEDWVNPGLRWIDGAGLAALTNGAWQYTETGSWIYESTSCIYACWGGSNRGLFISMPSFQQWGQQFGHWYYSAPNAASYLANAWANPFVRHDHGCSGFAPQYFQPHDYVGMWYQGQWTRVLQNQALSVGSVNIQSWGEAFILGLHTGGSNTSTYMPCWRDLYVGGAVVWLDDWAPPQISATASGAPSGWFGASQQLTIGASTSDSGLGVRLVTLAIDGKGVAGQDNVGCTGTRSNPCPNNRFSQFKLTGASFAEGVRNSSVSVEDPTGKPATGGYFQTKVDYSPPEVSLKGQLAEATEDDKSPAQGDDKVEKLRLPVYNLEVIAEDGSNASYSKRRSGVQNIEVFLDGVKQSVPWSAQSATEDSRPMTQTYQLKLSTVDTAGPHVLKVLVRDQVGNVRERTLEFQYFPATGMKDEYVMHYFPLPNGQGNEAEEEHPDRPELAVNVMNGNLVYRQQDVEVEGSAVDLEVERYYNSQLPEAENTEWGDGWTLAQTPGLDPKKTGGSQVPNQAEVLDPASVIEDGVALPTTTGTEKFDSDLRATVTKKASGGYELRDETGEAPGTIAFDATGQAEALLTDGYAKVDYSYEGGALSEIAVKDPGSTNLSSEEVEALIEEGEGGSPEPEDPQPSFAGQAAAGLPAMYDAAVDESGNTWVLDRTHALVLKYGPAGQLLNYFGWEGTQAGKFKSPSGIAIDPEGFIWVADSGNNRIQKLAPNGSPVGWFGSYGSGEEQFIQPSDIAIDEQGNVWIADTGNSRLQKFGPWGEFLGAFGSPGSGDGEFLAPKALDIGPEGDVWVADTYNDRVQRLGLEGEHLLTSEVSIPGPEGIVLDAAGEPWVSSASAHALWHLGSDGDELGVFGSYGSGEGLLLNSPQGLTVDSGNHLFIADIGNSRVVRWELPAPAERLGIAMDSFGAQGAGEGQMESPTSIAVASSGDIWVADTGNGRVQRFDSEGELLGVVGTEGSASGEFSGPLGIATTPSGDVWVADTGNGRVQRFDSDGEYLDEFGTLGEGPGEFNNVVAVAPGSEGDLWTLDSGNNRVQHFDTEGNYLGQFGEYGSEKGQLMSPSGLAVDPIGNVWVADPGNMRVMKFNSEGQLLRTLKPQGGEPMPTGVEVDSEGNVWVSLGFEDLIRGFTSSGRPLASFGAESSEYELSLPYDLAVGPGDDIWAVGMNNSVVQRWHAVEPSAPVEAELPQDDPVVDLQTDDGLVSSLEGEEAGEHDYEHEGDFLVSHDGPDGETLYEQNPAGLLSKVTLANGTWASIEYLADKRVKSVTVKLTGQASKTTTFEYIDAPQRKTVVDPSDAPRVTYEISSNGSVFKSSNAEQPPVFDFLAGTLWDHRENEGGLWAGDHILEVQAFHPEGIASIQIIANGNQLVHEMTCEQTAPGTACVEPPLKSQWVINTDQLAPGHLQLEVIAIDQEGGSASRRFWVDIPEPPPPPASGTPIPPKFAEILRFRTEYGLEKVFPVANEIERNERIFNLIKAWYEGDVVARSSWERWGVPLRPQDVAELEYREFFYNVNAERIDHWVEEEKPTSFAGYYINHAAGGIMHVGFVNDQDEWLQIAKTSLSLIAEERLQVYPSTPTISYLSIRETAQSVSNAIESSSTLNELVVNVEDDESGKAVRVGTPAVAQVESILDQMVGPNAPITVEYDAGSGSPLSGRFRNKGRMRAGDFIASRHYGYPDGVPVHDANKECTAGFGAKDKAGEVRGDPLWRFFVLTAGHCTGFEIYAKQVFRSTDSDSRIENNWKEVGYVTRDAYTGAQSKTRTDAEAIKVNSPDIVPQGIYGWNGDLIPTGQAGKARIGNVLCFSGAKTQVPKCGRVVARSTHWEGSDGVKRGGYWVKFSTPATYGDSGAPVWSRVAGSPSIGLVSAGRPLGGFTETLVVPLLHPYKMPSNVVPGILHDPALQPLSLKHP